MAFLRLTVLAGVELRSQLINTDHVQRVLIDGSDHTVLELTGGRMQRVEEAFEDIAQVLTNQRSER